jgi:flagellar hook-basal body protein
VDPAALQRIQIPIDANEDPLSNVSVENDGNIFAAFGKTGDLPIATISLSIFSNPNGLRQLGSGAYAPTADAGKIFLGKPTAPGFGNLTSGFIEGSNVDITDEMTNMIRAQQQFSGAAKIMQANSDMIEKLTR